MTQKDILWLKSICWLWFDYFLHVSDNELKHWVDLYNEDKIDISARIALEAIESMSG